MRKTTITIKRPEGNIEVVDVTDNFTQGLTDQMFKQIKKTTEKAGRGVCLSYNVEDIDTRTEAEKDYSRIAGQAIKELNNAENSNYSDPSRIIKARMALDAAKKEWADKYPEEAKKEKEEAEREEADRQERIGNSEGYKRIVSGRD